MPFPSQCAQNNWRSPLLPHSAASEWNSSCVTTATNQLATEISFFNSWFQFAYHRWFYSCLASRVERTTKRMKMWDEFGSLSNCQPYNVYTEKCVFVRVGHSLLHHLLFFVRLVISWLYSLHKLMLNSVGRNHETRMHKTQLSKEPFLPFFHNTNLSMYRPKIPWFKKPSIFCIVYCKPRNSLSNNW